MNRKLTRIHARETAILHLARSKASPKVIGYYLCDVLSMRSAPQGHRTTNKPFQNVIPSLNFFDKAFLAHIPRRCEALNYYSLNALVSPRLLEIGGDEGFSSAFRLSILPAASSNCVDVCNASGSHEEASPCDLIFIDGTPYCENVLHDGMFCINLLRAVGLLIFDDYPLASISQDGALSSPGNPSTFTAEARLLPHPSYRLVDDAPQNPRPRIRTN